MDEPLPGRAYRIRCRCGNVVQVRASAPTHAPAPAAGPARGWPPAAAEAAPTPPPADGGRAAAARFRRAPSFGAVDHDASAFLAPVATPAPGPPAAPAQTPAPGQAGATSLAPDRRHVHEPTAPIGQVGSRAERDPFAPSAGAEPPETTVELAASESFLLPREEAPSAGSGAGKLVAALAAGLVVLGGGAYGVWVRSVAWDDAPAVVEVKGSAPAPEAIRAALASHRPDLDACLETAGLGPGAAPEPIPDAVVRVTVAPSGAAAAALRNPALDAGHLGECVRRALAPVSFPAFEGAAVEVEEQLLPAPPPG